MGLLLSSCDIRVKPIPEMALTFLTLISCLITQLGIYDASFHTSLPRRLPLYQHSQQRKWQRREAVSVVTVYF